MTPRPRLLVAKLFGEDYKKAITAHKDKQLVELSGMVVRSGRNQRLIAESPLTAMDIT